MDLEADTDRIVVLVLVLKEHKVDEEDSSEEEHTSDTVCISRELDAEVIGVGEELLESRELLADEATRSSVVGISSMEDLDLVVVPDAAATAELVDDVALSVTDGEERTARVVLLAGGAEELVRLDASCASVDVHGLVAALALDKTTAAAHRAVVELTLHTDDLLLAHGADGHRELTTSATELTAAEAGRLLSVHDGHLGGG